MLGYGGFMLLVAADVKQAAMDAGVQGLDTAVEHLRKAGQLAHVFDGEAGLAQCARRSAGGDQLHAKAGQRLGKFHQAGFVGHAEQCPPNPLHRSHSLTPIWGFAKLQSTTIHLEEKQNPSWYSVPLLSEWRATACEVA